MKELVSVINDFWLSFYQSLIISSFNGIFATSSSFPMMYNGNKNKKSETKKKQKKRRNSARLVDCGFHVNLVQGFWYGSFTAQSLDSNMLKEIGQTLNPVV